jgi:hypothetical protein
MSNKDYIQKIGQWMISIFMRGSPVETYGGLRFANPPYAATMQ